MWNYIKRCLPCAILAALFMIAEVMMDLIQPGIMARIVDSGVLGLDAGGVGDLELIWTLGLRMIALVLFGGLCGSLNNVFTHISSQNIGNDMRKDAFRRLMSFSFPQLDRFGTGSLVTRVTNDITQVQTFVSLFVRGLIRTSKVRAAGHELCPGAQLHLEVGSLLHGAGGEVFELWQYHVNSSLCFFG